MNKLFGLFILALACWAPDLAQAAARFAVCTTTCTWDNSSTAMWSTTSGGATGASAPTSSDDVTLDAATCVGGTTCTITTFAGTISINSLTMSACTASTSGCILEASTNNTNFTIAGSHTNTGAGARTINMGTGTWTFTGASSLWNVNASLTLSAASSTINLSSGSPAVRQFVGGAKTYGTVIISGGANSFLTLTSAAGTFGTFTVGAPNRIWMPAGQTHTFTTITTVTGTSSTPVLFASTGNTAVTFSSPNNWTCDWCGFSYTTFSGGGTFSASNSLSFGNNTGITISPPSGGGGGGGRIIGG